MGIGVLSVKCEVWGGKCKVWSVKFGVEWSVECKVGSGDCGV